MPYFVRIRGKAFGPFDEEQLKEMKSKGKLGKTTEISENKVDWYTAGDLGFLFSPSSSAGFPSGVSPFSAPGFSNAPPLPGTPQETADWFYSANGTDGYGPVTRSAILQMLQSGTLQGNSLVWQQGQNAQQIKTVGAFSIQQSYPSQQSYPPQQSAPPQPSGSLFCAACGNPVVAAAQMCPKCGSPIIRHQQQHQQQQHYQQQFSSSGMNFSHAANNGGTGYFDVLKKYVQFSGRARRKEYWNFYLVNMLIYFVVVIIAVLLAAIVGGSDPDAGSAVAGFVIILYWFYALAIFLPSLAVCIRRLHDVGHSGWMIFISLIPLLGPIILLVFLVQDSQPGSNFYGLNPKYPS